MLCVSDVLSTSICPDRAHVRTVLAGVFNRDIRDGHTEELSEHEAVVVLAAKMLLDMGHKSGHVQAIFRYNKERLLGRQLNSKRPVVISIADNRYAVVFDGSTDSAPVFDFTTGEQGRLLSTPLLQMSINLTKLLALVQAEAAARESRSRGADS